jgi:hypothetical protein
MDSVKQNHVREWTFTSGRGYDDPFNNVELNALFTMPDGAQRLVPAFWAGRNTWGVRYASPQPGVHRYRTICSDEGNSDLHGQEGAVEVVPYDGSNPLLRHGPLRVAADRRHLEHWDGTPFFWLGDTWWMALCRRLRWPDELRELVADRVAKGFSLIQIVAGLYPDMPAFDERGANEAGFPWERDLSRINPAYFAAADRRITYLVESGLVPCIVGSWGYFMDFAGLAFLKRHWRNLIARWGAYPVVWCAAGEALMRFYVGTQAESSPDALRARWTELVRYIRATDPHGHPVTIHPTRFGHDQVSDPSVLDIDMLQTGHSGYASLADTVNFLETALAHEPRMPVLVGEVNYEGILGSSHEEMQRFQFWTCMLSGAAGHTYGANGLWQVNRPEQPYGASPHGMSWGHTPWNEAYRLPGSRQLGLAKRLLERYPWWRFEPHPEWIEPHEAPGNRLEPYAAGIPGQVCVVFVPAPAIWGISGQRTRVKCLDPGVRYRGFWFNPITGEEHDLGSVRADAGGDYAPPRPPIFQDWVLVIRRDAL